MGQNAVAQLAALRGATGGVTSSMNGASAATRGFGAALNGTNLVKWGSQMQWIGRQIEYNFTLPLLAAGGFAVKWAMDNERAFTRLSKVYGDTDLQAALGTQGINNELQALQRNLVALSNYFGIAQADAINIAADWAAAGSSGVALARATKLTMQAMVLGELDAKAATEALIAIQSQFAFSTEDLAKTLNQLNMVENQTGVSMGGLIQAFSRAAGVARSAGIDTLHLAAMIAAMTPAAGSAAQAGNALKTIISRLLSPTKEATEVLGLMGINMTDMGWKSANAAQRLEILAKNFTNLSDGQKAVVSAVVASRYQINKFDVLMEAIINKQSFYHKALNSAADADRNAAQAQRELNAVLDSNPKKMDQIVNIMKNASAEIGQDLIPTFLMAANAIRLVLQWFNNLDPSVRKFIITALVFLALLGPIIRYVSVLATSLGLLIKAFVWVGAAAAGATARMVSFTAVSAAASFIPKLGAGLILLGNAMIMLAFRTVGAINMFFMFNKAGIAMWAGASKIWSAGIAGLIKMMVMFNTAMLYIYNLLRVRMVVNTALHGIAMTKIWAGMWGALATIMTTAGAGLSKIWATIMLTMRSTTLGLWSGIVVIFQQGILAIATVLGAGMRLIGVIWRAWMGALAVMTTSGMYAIGAVMSFVGGTFANIFMWIWIGITKVTLAGQKALIVLQGVFSRAWVAMWAAMNLAVGTLLGRAFALYAVIMNMGFKGLLKMLGRYAMMAVAAMTGPWGIGIAAVVALLIIFWDDIKKIFSNIVNYIQKAFNALPAGVRNALMAVVNMVKQAAMAIYRLFSYINPFAHHSPSLVENVTNGLGVVGQQFELMERKVSSTVQGAYQQIKAFGAATSGLLAKANALELADVAETFKKAGMSGMFPQYQALNNTLIALQGELAAAKAAVEAQEEVVRQWEARVDAANKALDEQQAILDKLEQTANATSDALSKAKEALQGFVDTPISGELALGDAIRQNQLEQKKLQLEMLKMEQAGDKLDDIKNKYQEINGMIELLRGEQASLRNAGAGSEILGAFDGQIAALEAQRDALQSNQGPLNQMSKALDELKLKGEMLDLEKAINFDALHDEIERASKSMVEMPFDEIMAGVKGTKAQVDQLTATYETQKAAVDAQKAVVDNYKAARDALQASYDVEQQKLSALRDAYSDVQDAVSAVEEAMQQARGAADAMVQAMEKAKSAKDGMSPGAQNFLDAAGADFPNIGGTGGIGREGGLGDQSSLIDEMTKDLEKELNKQLESLNPFNWIKKGWNATVKWWNETVVPWFKDVFGGISFGGGGKDGGGDGPFAGFVEKAKDFWDTLKEIWGWLTATWDNLGELFGPTMEDLKKMFEDMGPPLKDLWEALKDLWSSLDVIWPILKIVAYVVGGILLVAFFLLIGAIKIVADTLIGILGPVINGIIRIIEGVVKIFTGLINFIVGVFTGDWSKAWEGIKQIFGGVWDVIAGLVGGVLGGIWGGIKGFVTSIWDIFVWLYDVLVGHSIIPDLVNAIFKWMSELPGRILGALQSFGGKLVEWATNAWNGFLNKVKEIGTAVINWGQNLKDGIINKLSNLGSLLSNSANTHWQAFLTAAKAKIDSAIATAKNIPGQISSALGNLGSYLQSKGADLIQGLINGITSKVTAVKNSMANIANTIKSYLPGSPVKAGPMKGRGELRFAGQKLITNIVQGIEETRPILDKSMGSVSGDISGAFQAVTSDTARSAGRFVVTSASALRAAATSQANDMLANQARLSTLAMNAEAGVINTGNTTVINLNGDLVLPNVSSGADAESFVRNLEALASGGRG